MSESTEPFIAYCMGRFLCRPLAVFELHESNGQTFQLADCAGKVDVCVNQTVTTTALEYRYVQRQKIFFNVCLCVVVSLITEFPCKSRS